MATYRNSGNSQAARRAAEERQRQEEQRREEQRREEERRQEEERQRREEEERRERERQRQLAEANEQKNNLEAQKAEQEQQLAINEEKILRLQQAKSALEGEQSVLRNESSNFTGYAESQDTYGEWIGEKQTEVKGLLGTEVCSGYSSYINEVDAALDAICNEITRLQNENYEIHGVIGQLVSWINSLVNTIRTLCN